MYGFIEEIKELLRFLFEEKNFKIMDKQGSYDESTGYAYVLMSNGVMDIRFIRDRGQKLWDIKSSQMKKNEWSSIGILRHIFLNDQLFRDFLNHPNARFIKDHYADIEGFFGSTNLLEARKAIKQAKSKRSKFLFG